MIIDLEARNSPRYAAPQISFRRNDNDRRPARVFARPNDYAKSIEEREAESARRLAMLTAKRLEAQRIFVERMDAPKTHLRESDQANAARVADQGQVTQMKVLRSINGGLHTLRKIQFDAGTSEGNARRVAKKLEAKGLITVDIVAAPEFGRSAKAFWLTITPAGVEALQAYWGQS